MHRVFRSVVIVWCHVFQM